MPTDRSSLRGPSPAFGRRHAAPPPPATVRAAPGPATPAGLRLRLAEAAPTGPRGLALVSHPSAPSAPITAPPDPAAPVIGQTITHPADPRWVLAVRTAEELQGTILPAERRERLVRLGKLLGLTAFDANLVIAIVQDQARRGFAPAYCPTAGEPQLRMVPLTPVARLGTAARRRKAVTVAWVLIAVIALELLMLRWFVG